MGSPLTEPRDLGPIIKAFGSNTSITTHRSPKDPIRIHKITPVLSLNFVITPMTGFLFVEQLN